MITREKKKKFCGKKCGPNQGFFSRKKSSKTLKKKVYEKKKNPFLLICADMIFKIVCRIFLGLNGLEIFLKNSFSQ